MKITVIGGSGFLGSHVADHLTESGHDVIIYDKKESNWKNQKQNTTKYLINAEFKLTKKTHSQLFDNTKNDLCFNQIWEKNGT